MTLPGATSSETGAMRIVWSAGRAPEDCAPAGRAAAVTASPAAPAPAITARRPKSLSGARAVIGFSKESDGAEARTRVRQPECSEPEHDSAPASRAEIGRKDPMAGCFARARTDSAPKDQLVRRPEACV